MQATREHILNILKKRGQATVSELSGELALTTVTIRHHLDTLRREGLVGAPFVRHRKAPGRPQHVYTLTEEASDVFPKRYGQLMNLLLEEVQSRLPPGEVDEIMRCIGRRMAAQVTFPDGAGFEERLKITVEFLRKQGYMARWERHEDDGYLIHVANCPYEAVSRRHHEICVVDDTFLSSLLSGASLQRRDAHAARGNRRCTYLVILSGE